MRVRYCGPLGARRGLILGGLFIEFSALGLFAGMLATVAAELSVAMLQIWVLDMSYAPSPWLWPLGLIVGTVVDRRAGCVQLP